jgi:hypothetical protein
MKKNTKSVKSKNKTIKINKNKVTAAVETAPVTETAAVDNTPVPVINIPANNQPKRGRGRPAQSSSQSLVSLADLIAALPPNFNVLLPLPNPYIRSLNNLGMKISSTPFKAGAEAMKNIVEKYNSAKNSVQTIDLNKTEVTV